MAVIVPGYRNQQASANGINRWRTRIGLRSVRLGDRSTMLVLSGGAVNGRRSEAELMAEYAVRHLKFDGQVLLEDQSRTSWENVVNVLPLIEHADRIVIASQPAHALKIRAYVRRQRPELAEQLVRGSDYRLGEWAPLKPILALAGLWTLRSLERGERRIR